MQKKDKFLSKKPEKISLKKFILFPDFLLAQMFMVFIKFYQKTISPDHSHLGQSQPFVGCKFYPSCSVYSLKTLEKFGFFWGMPKIIWRVLRCNPWNKGGIDDV